MGLHRECVYVRALPSPASNVSMSVSTCVCVCERVVCTLQIDAILPSILTVSLFFCACLGTTRILTLSSETHGLHFAHTHRTHHIHPDELFTNRTLCFVLLCFFSSFWISIRWCVRLLLLSVHVHVVFSFFCLQLIIAPSFGCTTSTFCVVNRRCSSFYFITVIKKKVVRNRCSSAWNQYEFYSFF